MAPQPIIDPCRPRWAGIGSAAIGANVLDHLQAVVLLAGFVRASHFTKSIGRSLLGLPIDSGRTILDFWREQFEALANHLERPLPVRVMVDRTSPMPSGPSKDSAAPLRFEVDPDELRGTGGLLHDVAQQYDDDDYILVANAAQILLEPLSTLAAALASTGGEASLVSHEDGTPSGLMLLRCGCLRDIPSVGFVDLKEQALPQIARSHRVMVVRREQPTGLALRTLPGYVSSLMAYHRRLAGVDGQHGAFVEDWRPSFNLVESGATVDASARVHDSVVLAGSRVGAGATLVRSVVCPGASVARKSMIVDALVTSSTVKSGRALL